MPFAATRIDLEIIILNEVSLLYDITYMWNLKYDTNELIYKRERFTVIERRKEVGRDKLGVWD